MRGIPGTEIQTQMQNQNQNHKRTRSQLALPAFNVVYDRSPLKHARDAVRRANARFSQSPGPADTDADDANDGRPESGLEGEVNAEMNDVSSRVGIDSGSDTFKHSEYNAGEQRDAVVGEVEFAMQPSTGMEDEGLSSARGSHPNAFDFTGDATDAHPKYPKRARSASFDETSPPSPSGSDANAGGNASSGPSIASPPHRSVESNSNNGNAAQSSASMSSSDSTPIMNGSSNPKRAKLAAQGTLDAFFARPSPSPSSSSSQPYLTGKQSKPLPSKATTARRIFSDASSRSSSHPDSSTPTQGSTPRLAEGAAGIFVTPTIKQLRAIPSLDLRTVTPSPRKRTLQLGHGTPGTKSPLKARAVSAGAALTLGRSEAVDEDHDENTSEHKEESKRAASGPHEDTELAQKPRNQTPPRASMQPLPPTSSVIVEEETEAHTMDIDTGSRSANSSVNRESATAPTTEQVPPSITVSTSTSTITLSSSSNPDGTTQQRASPAPPARAGVSSVAPMPSTPRHKILPSRPLPSGKSHLSRLLSMSPLTPISGVRPARQDSDEYDYEEEERAMREEVRRADVKEAAKLAMQEEGETEAASELPIASVGSSSVAPASAPVPPVELAPASATIASKPNSKGKHKGKALSSASRVAAGAAGIKKRKSLVSTSSTTPRMRLTRATVLRQKAVQAQMRTPKEGNSRPSLFGTKDASVTRGLAEDGGVKGKETAKEGTVQEENQNVNGNKHFEPQPQRSPRKTFVLTVPSSLSPRKSGSVSSSANSSITLKSAPVESGPTKPFTFSLYPPSVNDAAATARAQRALSNLSSALDKLAMPPPSKPNTSSASRTAFGNEQLRRPASEQRERIRPATSLGFTREMSVPVSGTRNKESGRPRALSRAGSVDPAHVKKSFLPPPPPPAFGSSLVKEEGKAKTFANASRTAPVAFGSGGCKPDGGGNGQPRPPSSFRFGFGSIGGAPGVFGRPIPRIRASQKTSLETVQGSPVKGGPLPPAFTEEDEDEIVAVDSVEEHRERSADGNTSAASHRSLDLQSPEGNANGDTSLSFAEGNDAHAVADNANATTSGSGKELKRISKLNASRRASMAFSALSQSLGTSPDIFPLRATQDSSANTDTTDKQSPAEPSNAAKQRTVSATFSSSTSSRPVRAAAPRSFAFGYPGLGRTQSETAVSANARSSSVTPAGVSESDSEGTAKSGSKKSGGGSMGRTKMPGSLDVLNQCTIFVDVRTEEGEDAGALFVDMLRGLGAKVLTRVGQTCTHIVYKNGLASTLTRYRLLDEPRPSVVGIGWVVECVEKRARVEEARFSVNLEEINVAGTLKRRRSFLPKQISSSYATGPMDAFLNGSGTGADVATTTHQVPKAFADLDPASEDGETSQERVTFGGSGLSSNIHPLERARRRSIMISR